MNITNYEQFLINNPLVKKLDPVDLPSDLSISTITVTCKLPIIFNVMQIAKNLPLSSGLFQTIKCGNSGEVYRSLVDGEIKKKYAKKKINRNSTRNFYNQVTIVVSTNEGIKLNVKLFKNGSIQITGCKKLSTVIWALDCVFKKLKMPITNSSEKYVSTDIFLGIEDIYDFSIAMINSDFKIGFQIDREKLFDLLKKDGYDCVYDPARHAGVNLRYSEKSQEKNKEMHVAAILIFDKGSIIITGARCYREIISCYKFINNYLIENYSKIVRINND